VRPYGRRSHSAGRARRPLSREARGRRPCGPCSLGSGRRGEVPELVSELGLGARLELARALAADAELTAEGGEGDLLVGEEALFHDEPLASIEDLERAAQ